METIEERIWTEQAVPTAPLGVSRFVYTLLMSVAGGHFSWIHEDSSRTEKGKERQDRTGQDRHGWDHAFRKASDERLSESGSSVQITLLDLIVVDLGF